MAANILGLGERRRPEDDMDDLLGMRKTQGMTDNAFQAAGRAPVDELWAGKYSAAIDDNDFDERAAEGKRLRDLAIDQKGRYLDGQPEFNQVPQENEWQADARTMITNESGLDLYPGHLNSNVKNPIFMEEFSDEAAKFKDDAFERMASGDAMLLGQVFDHPEFYKHYPEAQGLPISYRNLGNDSLLGSYMPPEGTNDPDNELNQGFISLNNQRDMSEQRGTLLHELQHYIQGVEGWEGGGMAGPELGHAWADNLENHADPTSPTADAWSEYPEKVRQATGEIMPFMQNEAMAQEVAHHAYSNLTGEQLARDATARDEAGDQVDNYYFGPTDGNEYGNWNPTQATNAPMAGALRFRDMMQKDGLMGILDWDNEVLIEGTEIEDDPYLESYRSLLNL
jgi:hypothetical protein